MCCSLEWITKAARRTCIDVSRCESSLDENGNAQPTSSSKLSLPQRMSRGQVKLTISTNALNQLKALGGAPATPESKGKQAGPTSSPGPSAMKKKASVTDCCICLFSVTVCQSLFIAYVPCCDLFACQIC
jgi:hypothetical protein